MPKTFYQKTKNEKHTIKNKRIRKKLIEEMRNEKLKDKNKILKNLTNNYQ